MIVATCRKVAGSSSTRMQKDCGLLYPVAQGEGICFQSSHVLGNKHKLKDRSPKSQNPRKEAMYSLQYFISKLFPMLLSLVAQR